MKHRFGMPLQFLAYLFQLLVLPLLLLFLNQSVSFSGSLVLSGISLALVLAGWWGLSYSNLLILRFAEGNIFWSAAPRRLADVGLYARTRHPYFWFISIYALGILTLFLGYSLQTAAIWAGFTLLCLSLLPLQERQLLHSLGNTYAHYQKEVPFLRWRFSIAPDQQVQLLPQLVWLLGRLYLKRWYRIQVQGWENLPHTKPFLVVANHESYLDPFLFGIFIPFEIKFVTTADVFTTPWMRLLLKGIGTFPMRRHRQDLKSIRTMIRMVNHGQVVGIFPEGGRSLDGTPLPVLRETLKLIQRCKVPLLPVQLQGAYEIWPRWAPNRRRGQVTVTFKPMISVAEQSDLALLETQIRSTIFQETRVFSSVTSRAIARGLDNFLWACPQCFVHNCIRVDSTYTITCESCGRHWQMASDYTLKDTESGTEYTLPDWQDIITKAILQRPPAANCALKLAEDETCYLTSDLVKYTRDDNDSILEDTRLSLTNQRMILFSDSQVLESWNFDQITILTLDTHHAISIGVSGVRHAFYLPENDISLRWQAHFNSLNTSSS